MPTKRSGTRVSTRSGRPVRSRETRSRLCDDAIRKALRARHPRGGATLYDQAYAGGAMQHEFRVYGRAGEPCERCGTPIAKIVVGGRGTSFCPTCQRSREQLVEPAVAVEAPELGVAADRPAVDEDLRHRPAAGRVEDRLPEGGIVVERDLLVRDARATSSSVFARTQ